MEDIKFALEDIVTARASKTECNADAAVTVINEHFKFEENQSSNKNFSILDLSGKGLQSISFVLCIQLRTLNISNNEFEILSDELQGLANLTCLDASHNKLKELPEWIGNLRNLVSLKLASNNLHNLPSTFRNLNLLKELDLSRNQFFKVPDSLQVGCVSLQSIDLSHNSIEIWLLPPASVSTLQCLSLAQNSLTSIPMWLCEGKATSLISLNLSRNLVFSQKQKLLNESHKSVLKELKVLHCFVSQSDLNFIGQFTSLIHLNLSNNLLRGNNASDNIIREIDISCLQFRKCLIQLLLRNISLVDLPEDIQELVSLQVLDCRDNQLFMLPNSICNLPQLEVCLLSNNSLCVLPEKFGDLRSLRELRLERNNITCVPESFGNLSNLHWLDLYGNFINEVPHQLGKIVKNLKGLDFEFNHISLCSEDESDDDHSWLPRKKYESLMNEMRIHPVNLDEDEFISFSENVRATGCRPTSVGKEDYSSSESSGRYYSESDSEPGERFPVPLCDNVDEVWDTTNSDTDNFDPNDHVCLPNPIKGDKRVINVPYDIIQRHKFCPSDLHVKPTKENISGITYAPEEGQFDDP